jgi:hypothetical protein
MRKLRDNIILGGAVFVGFGLINWAIDYEKKSGSLERHENLPARIKQYDEDRDGYLNKREIKRLFDDGGLLLYPDPSWSVRG